MSTQPRRGAREKKKRDEAKPSRTRRRRGGAATGGAAELDGAGVDGELEQGAGPTGELEAAEAVGEGQGEGELGDDEVEAAAAASTDTETWARGEASAVDDELEPPSAGARDVDASDDGIPDELRDAADEEEPVLLGDDTAERPGLEKARPASVGEAHLKAVLESLIFVADKPVPAKRLARIARARTKDVEHLVAQLAEEYAGRGIELVEVAGGYQFRSAAANAPFVRELVQAKPVRLTRAQLETLAIAAYRQPLTRPELEEIRGVDSGSALKVLLERGLVKILGRKDEPGRPLLYGTTPQFLELFGMSSLDQLPTLKEFSELSDESRALFARKTGEEIESIGDIAAPETTWESDEDEDEDESEAEARGEGRRTDEASAEGDGDDVRDGDDDDRDDDDRDDDDRDDDDRDDDGRDDDGRDDDDADADDDDADDDDADDDDADDDDADDDDDDADDDDDE